MGGRLSAPERIALSARVAIYKLQITNLGVASLFVANSATTEVANSDIANSDTTEIANSGIANSATTKIANSDIANSATTKIANSDIANSATIEIANSDIANLATTEIANSGIANSATTEIANSGIANLGNTKLPIHELRIRNVNSISLAIGEEERNDKTDETLDNTVKPTGTETGIPMKEAEGNNETKNKPKEKAEKEEVVEELNSRPVEYYLKHRINEKLIEGLVDNNRFNDSLSRARAGKGKGKTYNVLLRGPVYEAILKKKITKKEDIRVNFEIPCNIGGLKHVNALVDQGSDVNVMPYSTYMKLTSERHAETDIRLSLASHSYIYPLGTVKDVLVEVVKHVYPVDFVILDIKENEKRPFILGTPFLTTTKAVIKFDKGTITLRSGKSKISFHRIPDPSCVTEKGVKNDIVPIAPMMTVNRLVLEWEERIKLHLEREMEFNQ
ncbi:zinc finger, CCHC-type containing protein [Tanacetum coccineum]